jgi:hypothetical protein
VKGFGVDAIVDHHRRRVDQAREAIVNRLPAAHQQVGRAHRRPRRQDHLLGGRDLGAARAPDDRHAQPARDRRRRDPGERQRREDRVDALLAHQRFDLLGDPVHRTHVDVGDARARPALQLRAAAWELVRVHQLVDAVVVEPADDRLRRADQRQHVESGLAQARNVQRRLTFGAAETGARLHIQQPTARWVGHRP